MGNWKHNIVYIVLGSAMVLLVYFFYLDISSPKPGIPERTVHDSSGM